nr:MAG TPA: hypothetical protein [Caudoviricetes sp.]
MRHHGQLRSKQGNYKDDYRSGKGSWLKRRRY